MKVATLGFVSKVDEYKDKKTEALVRQVHVATGEHMIKCPLEDGQEFEEGESVLVAGELGTYDRRVFINGARIRHATPEDKAFFKFQEGLSVFGALPAGIPAAVAADAAAVAARNHETAGKK